MAGTAPCVEASSSAASHGQKAFGLTHLIKVIFLTEKRIAGREGMPEPACLPACLSLSCSQQQQRLIDYCMIVWFYYIST